MTKQNENSLLAALQEQNELIRSLNDTLQLVRGELKEQNQKIEQIRYSAAIDMQAEYHRKVTSNQLSFLDTLKAVADKRMSLARYGDGELGLTAHANRNLAFQRGSYALTARLQDIISEPRDGLLVALPSTVIDVFWMTALSRYWGILRDIIPHDRRWGVSTVTRAYAFKVEGQNLTDAWRACWAGRRVTVVTGEGSRFELIPELFSSAFSIDIIYGRSKHAFEGLDTLKSELLSRDLDLVLIALGPAGTVLAADLHDLGVQSLDIGHLSNSYNEVAHNAPKPELLPIEKK